MKSRKTIEIEKALYKYTKADKPGIYGCFECTLGEGYGNERIDYITMDSKSRFNCYEIKVSRADLFSKAKLSFHGDFNYFVMPEELYEGVKNSDRFSNYLWRGIGIIVYFKGTRNGTLSLVRKAKNKHIPMSKRVELMYGMVRSLSRFCYMTPKNEERILALIEGKAGENE